MKKRCAFTLIEMLVVIGIIAVLVGIILAVLPVVRQRSYEAGCLNNLRQLGQAFAMYKQDWGGVEAEPGRHYEPWQLGLPPEVIIINTDRSVTMTVGEFRLWKCPLSPSFTSPLATDYGVNYPSCLKENAAKDQACQLWREAVFRLGQKAWLVLDDNHWHAQCQGDRSGVGVVMLLNLGYEVRRFTAHCNALYSDMLWQEH